jgi:aminoglycoside phosphotransferase family enzyme
MPAKRSTPPSPLLAAADAFDGALVRFASLTEALRKGPLESGRGLERAAEMLREVAACEEDLQAHAQLLVAALGAAREAQQVQAELVRAQALEIQARSQTYGELLGRFEAIGKDAAQLNALAQSVAARHRDAAQSMGADDLRALLAELGTLQERMTAVAAGGEAVAGEARAARFEELVRQFESLRQQLLAARNKIGLVREALRKSAPPLS